jgi:hypothetical protein
MPLMAASYIPFLHPLNIFHEWWYLLLVPLAFGISVIYKAIRLHSLEHYWRQVTIMTLQIVFAMIGLAICLVILVQVVIPRLSVE